jgi:hypothetical protein
MVAGRIKPLSRRSVLATTAAGGVAVSTIAARAATLGNPDFPPQGLGPDGASSEFSTLPGIDWLAHTPPELVVTTVNLDPVAVTQFPRTRTAFMPA